MVGAGTVAAAEPSVVAGAIVDPNAAADVDAVVTAAAGCVVDDPAGCVDTADKTVDDELPQPAIQSPTVTNIAARIRVSPAFIELSSTASGDMLLNQEPYQPGMDALTVP